MKSFYDAILLDYDRVFLNRPIAMVRKVIDKTNWATIAGQRAEIPTSFMTIPRRMSRYQRMGFMKVAYRTGSGMLLIGNMKPLSMTEGISTRKLVSKACCWVEAPPLMIRAMPILPAR